MTAIKRTYVLPKETLEEFERSVAPRQRSAIITSLVQGWLEEQQRQKLRQEIIEGLDAMYEIYLEEAKAWELLEEEVARALDD